jgi:energy-converting hydrogenase Eha subunit C
MIPFGGILLAVGLIMALAVADRFDSVDLTAAGWIVAGVGALLVVAGLVTANSARRTEHRVVEDRHVTND